MQGCNENPVGTTSTSSHDQGRGGTRPYHPWLRPVTVNDLARLKELAQADDHAVIAPTHLFVKIDAAGHEAIVGYASIGAVALVLPWFSTTQCKARDSLYYINAMENLLANAMPGGAGLIAVPFMDDSPFAPHIERLGYQPLPNATLTFKKVR